MNPNQPTSQSEQLDPSIVSLTKAIGKTESGGDYNAKGKSGETGAYQFMPETWKSWAGTHLGDPNAPMTPENQDKVAYKQVEAWGKQGYKPAQIASLWNSGKPEWEGNVGTNSKGVKFDTPSYVKSVGSAYDQISKGNQNPKIIPNASTVGHEEGLGEQLKNRFSDAGSALSDTASGKINPLSGIIQTAGAVAGGIGDVVNAGLNLIPGVKQVEELVGKGFGKLTDTPAGHAVAKEIQAFTQAHPELSKDIGAGFNIVTAIPILRGLGVVKELAGSAAAKALRGVAVKGFVNDVTEPLARTIGGRKILEGKNFEDILKKGIVEPAHFPDIENVDGVPKFNSSEAISKSNAQIKFIDENELQPELQKAQDIIRSSHESEGLRAPSLEDIRMQSLENAKQSLQGDAPVNSIFERIKAKYGDMPTLADLNNAKRDVSNLISESAFGSPDYSALKNVRSSLQKAVEDGAKKLGLKDVSAINQKMRLLYQAQDILEALHGKKVKVGLGSKLLRKGVSVGSGLLAGQLGAGELGGLATGLLADTADKGIQGIGGKIRHGILKRTTGVMKKPSLSKLSKGVGSLVGGTMAQKQTR